MTCHFTLENVNTTKVMLLTKFGDHVHPDRKKSRKDSHNQTEKPKVCEDIIGGLFDIDDHIDFTCVALRWLQTVTIAPGEVPDLFLAETHVEMESKFKLYDDALCELRAKQLVLEQQQGKPLMSQANTQRDIITAARLGGQQVNQAGGDPTRLAQPSQGDQDNSFLIAADHRRRHLIHDHYNQKREQTQQHHNQLGQLPVVGKFNAVSGLRATPMPSHDVFVYKILWHTGID